MKQVISIILCLSSVFMLGCDQTNSAISNAPQPNIQTATPIQEAPKVEINIEEQIKAEMIEKQKIADMLLKKAQKIENPLNIGQMFNEVDANEHTCNILGRLLKKDAAASHLNFTYILDGSRPTKNFLELKDAMKIYAPDVLHKDSNAAWEMGVTSQSLSNWAFLAERLLKASQDKRAMEWNLDCAGQFGIPKEFVESQGENTFFEYEKESKTIKVLGDIEFDFSNKLIEEVNKHPEVETIALGSGGGVVYEAMRAGVFIRNRGLNTQLWNGCYSACPLVFFGGVERTIWSPYPVLVFHQISSNGVAVPPNDESYAHVHNYLIVMGVNAKYILQNMHNAPPQKMTIIDGSDSALCKFKVATWIQRNCSAEDFP